MNVGTIANGEAGSSVRTKLNSVVGAVNTTSTTQSASFSLASTDDGIPVRTTAATAINATVPSTLAIGWYNVVQHAAGQVTIVQGSGATLTAEFGGALKTPGNPSMVTIWVYANSGGSAAQAIVFGGVA